MIARAPWGGLAGPRGARAGPADVALLGIPYDGAVCFRAGAAQAPARLRAISHTSPAISEDGFAVDATRFRVVDLGDVAPGAGDDAEPRRAAYFARVEAAAREALVDHGFLLALGGDHSVTIPLVRAFADHVDRPFGLVLVDAHPDAFDTYDGSQLSHACSARRALDTGRLSPEHVLMLGTRSYNQVELEYLRDQGIRFVPARELDRAGIDAMLSLARERLAPVGDVYLTVDIDAADPACASGTGAPVAGGLSSRQLLDLVRGLHETLPVRAMDLVEIAPPLDPTDATLFLGLQLVFETFAARARERDVKRPSLRR
jgi:agmatinase